MLYKIEFLFLFFSHMMDKYVVRPKVIITSQNTFNYRRSGRKIYSFIKDYFYYFFIFEESNLFNSCTVDILTY